MEDDAEVASLYIHVLRNRAILLLFHVPVNSVPKKIIVIRMAGHHKVGIMYTPHIHFFF
jgi:hypothetical protein